MGHWSGIVRRAWREMREQIRWDTPVRVITGMIAPILSGALIWYATDNFAWSGAVTVMVVAVIGLCVFARKMITVPAVMAAERQTKFETLQVGRANREQQRRAHLVDRLINEYKLSHDEISPALLAGLELPPLDWLNERLASVGESWWIGEVHPNGFGYSMFEITPRA